MHSVQFQYLSGSDGSAIFCSGCTSVLAVVYGPTEIKISKELYDKAVVEVSFKQKVGQSDCEERFMEFFIKNALESVILTSLHPRTSIIIMIQEVLNSGNLLACSINAAYLALLDAGISLQGLVAATSIACIDNKLVPFPSDKELEVAQRVTTICMESTEKRLVGIKNSTFVSVDELKKSIEIAKQSTEELFQFYREVASKRYKKELDVNS